MTLKRPFFRIARPKKDGSWIRNIGNTYLLDNKYAENRFSSIRAFHILSSDLIKLFEYIEPCEENESTYSHRIYELFLRTATEIESNCKLILNANGYTARRLNIKDYYKINRATKFSEYEVRFNAWTPHKLLLKPFLAWGRTEYSPLQWYQNYNSVKHNRRSKFNLANLKNLMNAMSALFIILHSQYSMFIFSPYQNIHHLQNDENGFLSTQESLFMIKPPFWDKEERYEFDWNKIKESPTAISKFNFKEHSKSYSN